MDSTFSLRAGRPHSPLSAQVVDAIPVRDEAARLGRLLTTLAVASECSPCPVTALVLANNRQDETAAIARTLRHPAQGVETVEIAFAAAEAAPGMHDVSLWIWRSMTTGC